LLENTMIIFSSDNGPVLNDGYLDGAPELVGDHKPAGGLRGGKYSLFDAGTHIPFFVYWKGTISPVVSDALVCQMDLAASLGSLTGGSVPEGLDSRDLLPTFLGEDTKGRDALVLEAQGKFAMREGDYAIIPPYKGKTVNEAGNELGNLGQWGLFNLGEDPAQTTDLSSERPELLEKLKTHFSEATQGYYKNKVAEVKLQ
jgi:arylsulfatase A-like enzyme